MSCGTDRGRTWDGLRRTRKCQAIHRYRRSMENSANTSNDPRASERKREWCPAIPRHLVRQSSPRVGSQRTPPVLTIDTTRVSGHLRRPMPRSWRLSARPTSMGVLVEVSEVWLGENVQRDRAIRSSLSLMPDGS